jgi:hypothetical protein
MPRLDPRSAERQDVAAERQDVTADPLADLLRQLVHGAKSVRVRRWAQGLLARGETALIDDRRRGTATGKKTMVV